MSTSSITGWLTMAILLAGLLITPGCGSSVSVSEWQSSLDQFAADYANDDLSFLREVDGASSQRTFSIIGASTPEKSTDITGVLLGRRTIADRQWLIFLIGRVKARQVEDIRLALRTDDSGAPKWIVSHDNSDALRQYREQRDKAWRTLHPDRDSPPVHAFEFPAEEDLFQFDVNGREVIATHESSGARWVVNVP